MGKRADEIDGPDPLDARSQAALPIEPAGTPSGTSDVEGAYDPVPASSGLTPPGQADVHSDALAETEPPASPGENEEIVTARAEIEETRGEMSETIDAIQEKLSPEHLKEQATESVKEATVGRAIHLWGTVRRMATNAISTAPDAARTVGTKSKQTAQQKPIPVAAVATSLIALVVGARMIRARRPRPPSNPASGGQTLSQVQHAVGQVAASVQGTAARLTNRAQDRMTQRNTERRTHGRTETPSTQRGLLDTGLTVSDLIAGMGVAVALAILRRKRGANG